ncbi:MAG: phosphoglycerate kinase [Spirochaetae bacterium HGW-Spirochaetae-9]|nr:MAG: phosphoglycerate kinase [Spirochaetae bacterium HGW-Spirochaetae-9]
MRLNTWESIIGQLRLVRSCPDEEGRIQLLMELLINLRLLGQDSSIPDLRVKKGDIESIYAEIEHETRMMLESFPLPSDSFIYFAREVLKKLPVRQGAEEMIEQIRATAEAFEEDRSEDDPLRGFAGDLRKEVHRRLSPKIIHDYLEPYLKLVVEGKPEPIVKAGYVALPALLAKDAEGSHFIDLASSLLERMRYLWDYETGDLATEKARLAKNIGLFERCFLKAEVTGFLEMLTPEKLAKPHLEMDMLKRLASFKHFLKTSHREARISLYDFLLLDLSLGRLVFLFANDLTNNHFAEVTPRNLKDSLAVMRELLEISSVKGLAIGDVDLFRAEIDELRESSVYDFIKTKRRLSSISDELQRYLQTDIIDRMSGSLNRILEEYELPTSKLTPLRTRFFNNFIRRTQIHVLSEFTEKVTAAVNGELQRQTGDRQLYGDINLPREAWNFRAVADPRRYIAATWRTVDEKIRPFLGGKGNSLIDMARLGLDVPPAFILGFPFFSRCGHDGSIGDELSSLIRGELAELERQSGRRLGDASHPLLVSVRSGAPTSMPGVMATILNVGWSPKLRSAMEQRRGNHIASTLYRRFLENCEAALGLAPNRKKHDIEAMEARLSAALGPTFLLDPWDQLVQSIRLVYGSKGSLAVEAYSRAIAADIKPETAVTVQQLVFGNLNDRSLSGVFMTRNPITGDDELFGEFLRVSQGEEVVMGSANTEPLSRLEPELAGELDRCKTLLVEHFRQDLDLEFTVEDGRLYFLQARTARLGAFAHLVADTDFLKRGLIGLPEYRERIERLEMAYANAALPRADFRARRWNPPLTVGVPINSGVVSGTLVMSEERLKLAEERRESVVYFAYNTKPTDFAVMNSAHAIVTVYPGRTSHAAITAMSLNKPCIVGCDDLEIVDERHSVIFHGASGIELREGERVTADGNTGAVYRGVAPISEFFLSLASVGAAVGRCPTAAAAATVVRGLIDTELARLYHETNLQRANIDHVRSFAGAKVLVRVDANVGLIAGKVESEARILQILPTVKTILEKGGTPVVCSHLGDPGAGLDKGLSREEISRDFSLLPVAELLARELGEKFIFHKTSVAASGLLIKREAIVPGIVNLIENLRFASGEKDNDEAFARSLAELSDGWFVNDAFNVCLRRHASITSLPKFVEHRLAGPHVARELSVLEGLLEHPARPFIAVFEGKAMGTQLGVISALLPRVDYLAVIGSECALPQLYHDKLIVAGEGNDAESAASIGRLARLLPMARTVLWSGPAGLAEFAHGGSLDALAPHVAALHKALRKGIFTVVCSEEEKQLTDLRCPSLHLSTGPRAFLEYMERLSLPGITVLDPKQDQEKT